MVVAGRMIYNAGNVDVTCFRELMAYTDTGAEMSASEGDVADVFRDSQGCINSDNKWMMIAVVYFGECFGQISGMDGLVETAIDNRFFVVSKRPGKLLSDNRAKAVSGGTV